MDFRRTGGEEAGIEEPGLLNKWSWVFWKTMKIDLKERQMRPERI